MLKKVGIYVIQYETKVSNWKVYMLAESRDDAVKYLIDKMGQEQGFRMTNIESRETIHVITDKVRQEIIDSVKVEKEQTIEKPVDIKEVREKEKLEESIMSQCPFCDAEFTGRNALRMHILSAHLPKTKAEPKEAPAKKPPKPKGKKKTEIDDLV